LEQLRHSKFTNDDFMSLGKPLLEPFGYAVGFGFVGPRPPQDINANFYALGLTEHPKN
jgi:hypothetical protein